MKSSFLIFFLISALLHAVIINMQDEWVFSISEYPISKYHEQGSSTLNIRIASEKNNIPLRSKQRKKENKITEKPSLQPIIKKNQIASLSTSLLSENMPLASKTINLKKNNFLDKKTISEKDSLDFTPANKPAHQSNSEKTRPENSKKITLNNVNDTQSNNKETLKTLLNEEMAKHFYYPRAAQRKNREGNVILAFTINNDGGIENIHINKSSGYAILDNAAIKALNKIDANKNFARLLSGRNVEQMLPIRYKLLQH